MRSDRDGLELALVPTGISRHSRHLAEVRLTSACTLWPARAPLATGSVRAPRACAAIQEVGARGAAEQKTGLRMADASSLMAVTVHRLLLHVFVPLVR